MHDRRMLRQAEHMLDYVREHPGLSGNVRAMLLDRALEDLLSAGRSAADHDAIEVVASSLDDTSLSPILRSYAEGIDS